MKAIKIVFAILVFTVPSVVFGQSLIKFEKDGKYGYIDGENRVVLKAQFPVVYTDTIKDIGFVIEPISNKILCINNLGEPLFYTFKCDNGPDSPQEGLFRIINDEGLIGFADLSGNIVIAPIYKFAYQFNDGKAKVSSEGYAVQDREYIRWEGKNWYYILNPLRQE